MEERNHDLNRTLENLNNASVEDINFLLNHFNGKPYMVDGMMHTPFNLTINSPV